MYVRCRPLVVWDVWYIVEHFTSTVTSRHKVSPGYVDKCFTTRCRVGWGGVGWAWSRHACMYQCILLGLQAPTTQLRTSHALHTNNMYVAAWHRRWVLHWRRQSCRTPSLSYSHRLILASMLHVAPGAGLNAFSTAEYSTRWLVLSGPAHSHNVYLRMLQLTLFAVRIGIFHT